MAFVHLKISSLADRNNTTVRFLMRGVSTTLSDLPAIGSVATDITGDAGEPPNAADTEVTSIICIENHSEPHRTHQGLFFMTALFEGLKTFPA